MRSIHFKMHGFSSLCVFTRTVLHERASVHDKRTTRHDNPVTQMTDKRGEEPASGRPRSPPSGGDAGAQKPHFNTPTHLAASAK